MGQRFQVVIADYIQEADVEQRVFEELADILPTMAMSEQEVIERGFQADAMLLFHELSLGAHALSKLTRCRSIVRVGVGFDNVDLKAAGELGIVVCNVPDYGTEDVADHALMMLIAIARRLLKAVDSIRGGDWQPPIVFGAPRLRGKTIGLIGCGRIGTAMALRAKALGMRVIFYDPHKPPGYEKGLGVERAWRLEELLPQSEFASLHCPLTDDTHHILNTETLALLPKGAYVVNTARGGCIDLTALANALDSGHVQAAALDVVEREPLEDERIRRHPRILLTPHVAFYSVEGYEEMRTKAAREARRSLIGEPVLNPVNLQFLKNPRCAVPSRQWV